MDHQMTDSRLPLVSVIVRSMDRPTLTAAINSLALQTYPNIEVLVVNAKGGTHSELAGNCGRFSLRVLNHTVAPLDRSSAANTGLDAVTGAFFAFLDDDDTLDPDHFTRLVETALAQQAPTVVYAGVRSLSRNDPTAAVTGIFAERWEDGKLLAGNFIPIHAPLVPTVLLAKGVRFDPRLEVYEDWDFWLQISEHARFVLSEGVTATYFLAGGSGVNPHSVDPDLMRHATLTLYAKWLPRLDAEDLWEVTRLYHDRNLALHGCYTRVNTLEHEAVDLRERLTVAHYDLTVAHHDLNDARNALDMMKNELADACARLDAQRDILDSLYNSRSWRLTAPLRALTRLLRRSLPTST